jgi:hypothetical protein
VSQRNHYSDFLLYRQLPDDPLEASILFGQCFLPAVIIGKYPGHIYQELISPQVIQRLADLVLNTDFLYWLPLEPSVTIMALVFGSHFLLFLAVPFFSYFTLLIMTMS